MPLPDRFRGRSAVAVTTTTTSTNTLTLINTAYSSVWRPFIEADDGLPFAFRISHLTAAEEEISAGILTYSTLQLTRDKVIHSSNGGQHVNFSVGTKKVEIVATLEDMRGFWQDVSDALDAITDAITGAVSSVFTRTGAVTAEAGDYDGLDLNLQDKTLQRPLLLDYAETVQDLGNVSGGVVINLVNGNVAAMTLTGGVTGLTLSNPPATGRAGSVTLHIVQDGTGGHTFVWTGPSVIWSGGAPPAVNSDAGTITTVMLYTLDGGTTWVGSTTSDVASVPTLAALMASTRAARVGNLGSTITNADDGRILTVVSNGTTDATGLAAGVSVLVTNPEGSGFASRIIDTGDTSQTIDEGEIATVVSSGSVIGIAKGAWSTT